MRSTFFNSCSHLLHDCLWRLPSKPCHFIFIEAFQLVIGSYLIGKISNVPLGSAPASLNEGGSNRASTSNRSTCNGEQAAVNAWIHVFGQPNASDHLPAVADATDYSLDAYP